MRLRPEERGFTLLEITVVIAIIAVMAMVAVPTGLKVLEKSKISSTIVNVESIKTAAIQYYSENSDWPAKEDDFTSEDAGGPFIERWPESPWKNSNFTWDYSAHKVQVLNVPSNAGEKMINTIGGSYSGNTYELIVR